MLERSNSNLILGKLFLILIGIHSSLWAETRFKVIQETYRGKTYDVRVPEEKGNIDFEKLFPDELLLGIESGHFDLIVGQQKLEGAFLPIPSWRESRGNYKRGILIRFPTLPKEQVLEIERTVSTEFFIRGFSLSCVSDACANLKSRSAIAVNSPNRPIFLSSTFKHILQNGFIDEKGKSIPFEIYKTNADEFSLAQRSASLAFWDVFYTGMSIGATITVGVTIKALSQDVFRYTKIKCGSILNRLQESWKTQSGFTSEIKPLILRVQPEEDEAH